ncbi:MAG: anhydro-N-acetylmuramic acid kinase [Prevotellaceae bacterium]|jgi:anhydro-N-acetylmuramic acid kinase|nr:anhydro-N-acetylmuramic acid kinase [Prevotellaceae bacterium]
MSRFPLRVLGLMSGTSLDGLDLCLASFGKNTNRRWTFDILAAETHPYSPAWAQKLQQAHALGAFDFVALHKEYGKFLGEQAASFLRSKSAQADYVASHGHTIFHQPQRGVTFQLGDGAALAAAASLPAISDFRSLDVALGGQGAPLVPVGDRLLFGSYDSCLNLGGFANISFEQDGQRVAFDVCPCNIALNALSRSLGEPYDKSGTLAAQGKVSRRLLDELNALDFYAQRGAKSLGREWVEEIFSKKIAAHSLSAHDRLRTVCEHIAVQVARCAAGGAMLVTGGGAFNAFLVQRIAALSSCRIVIPNAQVVNFKEALIFAFLGALYIGNEINTLASATGATRSSIGGSLVVASQH